MNTSLNTYKDLALKVVYYTKKRQLGNKIFFATAKFQEVLEYFERNLKDSQTFLKSCYFLKGKQIYPSDILLYSCIVDPNLRLVEEDMFLEIEELESLDDASEPVYEKLLKPLINPFKLIILNIKDGILQQVDFPKEKLAELGLDSINSDFACCNSNDSLYISCGKNFWIISHSNFNIEKKEMPFSKKNHSMAYILSNNTIFIAGGNEESFYYDINSKEFVLWGKMNVIQDQPALIQFGDFLYSFNSFSPEGIFFERTKLTNPTKQWEKLVPQSGDQESGFFYNKSFGVSKCSGGNILFAGGINNQLRTFIYNLKLNVLYITPNKDESILLNERNFYKIDHNFSIAIPTDIEKNHIIAIANKNSKTLNLVPFEHIGVKTRNNLLRIDNPRNRLPGNIIIKCRYMSMKDYENFLKQREMQQNNKTKGGFDIYNRNEQGIKTGENNNVDPYKYQYRGKTPALERISERKPEEENDDDDFKKNRSSSAKKDKRTLDIGQKLENIGKLNLATQKLADIKKDEAKNNNQNKNQNNFNIILKKVVSKDDENINSNKNKSTIGNNELKINLNSKFENSNNNQKNGETKLKDKVYHSETDKFRERNKKRFSKEVKHRKLNLNLEKKDEGKNNELNSFESSTPHSNVNSNKSASKANNMINNDQINKLNTNFNIANKINMVKKENGQTNILNNNNGINTEVKQNINPENDDKIKEKELEINKNEDHINIQNKDISSSLNLNNNENNTINKNQQQKNDINNEKIILSKSHTIANPKENNIINKINLKNNIISSNPFVDNNIYQNIGEKESNNCKENLRANRNKALLTNKMSKTIKTMQKKANYKTNTTSHIPAKDQEIKTDINTNNNINYRNINFNNNSINNSKIGPYKSSTHRQMKGKKLLNANHKLNIKVNLSNNESNNLNQSETSKSKLTKTEDKSGNGDIFIKINKIQNIENQRLNTNENYVGSINNEGIRKIKSGIPTNNSNNLSGDKIFKMNKDIMKNVFITKDGKKYTIKSIQKEKKEDDNKIKNEEKINSNGDENKNLNQ